MKYRLVISAIGIKSSDLESAGRFQKNGILEPTEKLNQPNILKCAIHLHEKILQQ